jgi:hypothetical protein
MLHCLPLVGSLALVETVPQFHMGLWSPRQLKSMYVCVAVCVHGLWVCSQAAVARRCSDDRPAVRKSAVQSLVSLSLSHLHRVEGPGAHVPHAPVLSHGALVTLLHAAGDGSTLVRKTAVQLASDLLATYPCNEDLQRLWLDTALPIIGDKETTLEAKGVEFVAKHLVQGVATWAGMPQSALTDCSQSPDPALSQTNGVWSPGSVGVVLRDGLVGA